ncbi:4-hydroxyphenylacetaldehyde oxime monooxygenase [Aegilops tauschii subsp. strangulata]|uniref:4-hydroxyphenylacetaldehyde oxime monooxygenase n=2 Tax=Aegilops tauschii TaxID=37682 RepID=A0A453MMI8_AEGTS|nr:4-hydroxyphenylacetaldehyde oxime monooxygenase [Aegilops tauschii subsp. strangulata]
MLITHTTLLLSLIQQWELIFLALASVVSLLLLTRSRSRSSQKEMKLPPGPAPVPFLGNLHQLGRLPHRTLRDLARLHGPVMQLQLGKAPTVVLSSADAAWEGLKVHDLDCCTRPVSPGPKRLTYDLKNVAFAPFGSYWREIRKLLVVELLSGRRVKAAWYARQEQVEKLISTLSRAGGKPMALDEHILSLSDGIIGTVAFGNIYGSDKFTQNNNFQHALDEAAEVLSSSSAEDFFPKAIGWLIDRITGAFARRERIFKQLDAFFEMVIEQHLDPNRTKPENGGDLVDVLIAHWKEHRGTLKFTKDHVKALIFDTFIAGVDTSSVTILWAMSELMRSPRVLSKVQAEIRALVGGNDRVRSEDVSKLEYLKLVVKETLRLHPPAPLLVPRETMRHIQIGGYDVPAKTRIYVNAWAIGRDPASWPDNPEEFNPERFEANEIDFKGEHPQMLPFGTGRRICPGISMGMATVEFTLANMLCCFQWALPDGMVPQDVCMEEEGKINFHRKTPLVLVPTIR